MKAAALIAIALTLVASAAAARTVTVSIGSKAFTESVVLGEILARAARDAGATVEHRRSLGGTQILWKALLRGEIDAYVEYSGTIAEEILAGSSAADLRSLRAAVGRSAIAMSDPLGFNNTYAIGMLESKAARLGIRTIADLRAHRALRLGFSNEFQERRDGWPGLREAYGLDALGARGLDHDLAYRALVADDIDAIDLYSTDAEIAYYGLRVLDDVEQYFPRYDAVIVYRRSLDTTAPAVSAAFRQLAGSIDERAMIAMNRRAKLDKIPESIVADAFVDSLTRRPPDRSRTQSRQSLASAITARTLEHLSLVGISLLAAILAGVPLGIASARVRWLGQPVLAATSVIYTIPSLALLVIMIPLFGIGALPVLIALFLYSLLPIVRNTYTGLVGIAPALVESAIALGLSDLARLRRVELPLALPTILAGVKTAAVMNVATATIGALIGAGGYGQPILTGIRLDDMGLILQGAVPAAVMALLVQGAFELLERTVVPRGMRGRRASQRPL